jgi:hypothetical protein
MKVSDRITSPGGTRAYPVLPLRDIVVFPHVIAPVGVALQWSWPQVRIVVPVPTSSAAESWSLPTQMRTETRSKFEFPIRKRKFLFFAENSLSTPKNSLFHGVGNLAASHCSCTRVGIGKIPC